MRRNKVTLLLILFCLVEKIKIKISSQEIHRILGKALELYEGFNKRLSKVTLFIRDSIRLN